MLVVRQTEVTMPATEVRSEVIGNALQQACGAPSLDNSQPWRWVATDHAVEVFDDPACLVRSTDATGRESLIGSGIVLDHFRLPLAPPPDWDRRAAIQDDSSGAGLVRVDVIADELPCPLAEASQFAEALHLYDSDYQAELPWWTADFVARDGISHSSLISAADSGRVDVGRAFPVVAQPDRRSEVDHDRSNLLLSTEDDPGDSVIRCGEALSAVLLDAATAGMAPCTLTHVTEVPMGRDPVASLTDRDAMPQVLVRVGLAPALDATPPPTPRQPIGQVLQIHRGETC